MPEVTPIERLTRKSTVSPSRSLNGIPCVEFTGARDRHGYGRFYLDGRSTSSHRAAYLLLVGAVPEGLHLDHLCRNTSCCCVAHLEPVTPRENVLRGIGPKLTKLRYVGDHCRNGHPWAENAYFAPSNPTKRLCRACRTNRQRAHRANRRQAKDAA